MSLNYLGSCLNRLEPRCNLLDTGRKSALTAYFDKFRGIVAYLVEFGLVVSQVHDQRLEKPIQRLG